MGYYNEVEEMPRNITLDRQTLPLTAIDPAMRVAEALLLLRQSQGGAVPVVMPDTGEVVGVFSSPSSHPVPGRASVPRLGGMATPLGVYLTDGVSSGGAGFWGLFLSGFVLCALGLTSQALAQGFLHTLAREGASVAIFAPQLSGAMGIWLSQMLSWFAPTALTMLFIFTGLRLIPMSGTHAAEHQVVHCIEHGAPLVPDCVRAMPRVHPRCGTNIVVGFALFHALFLGVFAAAQSANFGAFDAVTLGLVAATPVTLIYWRRAGGWVQRWFATRPATDAQIGSAIFAARQVLSRRARYAGPVRFRWLRRVWAMGIGQVLTGYFTLLGALGLLAHAFPKLGLLLGL